MCVCTYVCTEHDVKCICCHELCSEEFERHCSQLPQPSPMDQPGERSAFTLPFCKEIRAELSVQTLLSVEEGLRRRLAYRNRCLFKWKSS